MIHGRNAQTHHSGTVRPGGSLHFPPSSRICIYSLWKRGLRRLKHVHLQVVGPLPRQYGLLLTFQSTTVSIKHEDLHSIKYRYLLPRWSKDFSLLIFSFSSPLLLLFIQNPGRQLLLLRDSLLYLELLKLTWIFTSQYEILTYGMKINSLLTTSPLWQRRCVVKMWHLFFYFIPR